MVIAKLKEIEFEVIEWIEGLPQDKQVFTTWSEANNAIWLYSKYAPDDGSYLKCDYTITWEDGQSYSNRFDLQRRSPNMSQEMEERMTFCE